MDANGVQCKKKFWSSQFLWFLILPLCSSWIIRSDGLSSAQKELMTRKMHAGKRKKRKKKEQKKAMTQGSCKNETK